MPLDIVTGNHAAGHALCVAGEANRHARGTACGIYPITPQTEIVERVASYRFTKGKVVAVESEHSAMAVSIGASLSGARAYTASTSNGLAYMFENIMVAGFYRLPIVMAAVNRTLGPPWNIWVDQGDTLMLRDFPWVQLYASDNQEVHDLVLLAFRLAEDHRILLPVMVCLDGFVLSHTQGETDLATQEQADRYLPALDLPHRLDDAHPRAIGAMVWPDATVSHRMDIQEAMERVPAVHDECRAAFQDVFGRDPGGVLDTYRTEDADTVLVASATIALTTRRVVDRRRAAGERVGMVKMRMFRPFPEAALREACASARRVGVLDRDYAAGLGGVWWQDIRAAFQGHRPDLILQDYLVGVGGGDVTPELVERIFDDLGSREASGRPHWADMKPAAEVVA
ncbi:MAG: pyruvate ferredoxin oxidoreductase [Gemmatimonadetes bacterium]|nr:pyruvate ferredoxin oxidoreductase [Gemmatimonadota bacterium]